MIDNHYQQQHEAASEQQFTQPSDQQQQQHPVLQLPAERGGFNNTTTSAAQAVRFLKRGQRLMIIAASRLFVAAIWRMCEAFLCLSCVCLLWWFLIAILRQPTHSRVDRLSAAAAAPRSHMNAPDARPMPPIFLLIPTQTVSHVHFNRIQQSDQRVRDA